MLISIHDKLKHFINGRVVSFFPPYRTEIKLKFSLNLYQFWIILGTCQFATISQHFFYFRTVILHYQRIYSLFDLDEFVYDKSM